MMHATVLTVSMMPSAGLRRPVAMSQRAAGAPRSKPVVHRGRTLVVRATSDDPRKKGESAVNKTKDAFSDATDAGKRKVLLEPRCYSEIAAFEHHNPNPMCC